MKLSKEELIRYARHLSLKEFGMDAQLKVKQSKILVVGAGGLGCPALLYLAAAGVGKVGIVDFDVVASHNLQRQVLFTEKDIGSQKATAAALHLKQRNSFTEFETHNEMLTGESALEIFPAYDLVLDCTDNFTARYAINDACVLLRKPFVYGSIFRFEGQVSLFNAKDKNGTPGPTYRCLFPVSPAAGTIPSCEEAGVIGFLSGMIGTIQAAEAIKWVTGVGETLSGKLLSLNALNMRQDIFTVERNEQLWSDTTEKNKVPGPALHHE
jgi:sulfur-carrier protein adenylyltransferase/sulfurtransferase